MLVVVFAVVWPGGHSTAGMVEAALRWSPPFVWVPLALSWVSRGERTCGEPAAANALVLLVLTAYSHRRGDAAASLARLAVLPRRWMDGADSLSLPPWLCSHHPHTAPSGPAATPATPLARVLSASLATANIVARGMPGTAPWDGSGAFSPPATRRGDLHLSAQSADPSPTQEAWGRSGPRPWWPWLPARWLQARLVADAGGVEPSAY